MLYRKLFLLITPLLALLISCAPEHSKLVVAQFGEYKIFMEEFEKAYAKNSSGVEKAKQDSLPAFQKFLDLYVNYKMKLRDAEVRGYKNDPDMRKELIDYKMNVGSALFLENELYKPRLHELYEKRKNEFRVSHIFLTPDSLMNEQQTKELGERLIDRLRKGDDFAAIAKEYSKDTYTKDKGGDVGFVTAGIIFSTALEDAVYDTPVGTVHPKLVYSGYGYHIIKVAEKHERRDTIIPQHIMAVFVDSTGKEDSARAHQKILEVQKQLNEGADFGQLAMNYSDDRSSASRNGEIGTITRGRIGGEFDNVAFKLNVGEISPIVKTQFGYHIIKLKEVLPNPSYEESKENLKEMYSRIRHKEDYAKLIEKLKNELKLTRNDETIAKILPKADSIKGGVEYWVSDLQKEFGNATLFSINNKNYTCDSLLSNLQRKGSTQSNLNAKSFLDGLDQYVSESLVNKKALGYDEVDPEFALLMEDYENGIYLFKILEEEVWSKVNVDSVKIVEYYEKTKDNYKWKDRVEFKEIYVVSDSLVNNYYTLLSSGYNFDSLATKGTQRNVTENVPGYTGLVEIDANELAKTANSLKNIGDISEPFRYQEGWSIVKLVKKDPSRLKTFDEVKAEIASLVQENESKRLEEKYINNLKSIYHPKYHYDELQNAFKKN